jgi:L-glyceraldehyde 3-phosphate reductase
VVRQGKALYVGLSNYSPEQTSAALAILRELRTPCIVHQPKYNMFFRDVESGLLEVLREEGLGCVVFSPLAQGLLTDRYLAGIPTDSRAAKPHGFLQRDAVTEAVRVQIRKLDELASARGQTLAQLAIAWVLRTGDISSAIIGASRISQLEDSVAAVDDLEFSEAELRRIDEILEGPA